MCLTLVRQITTFQSFNLFFDMKNTLLVLLMLVGAVPTALAADISGAWSGTLGDRIDIALELRADGKKLIGSVTTANGSALIFEGKINGNSFTFTVMRDGKTIPYKGTVEADKLTLSVTFDGKEYSGTLTRLKPGEIAPVSLRMRPQMTEYWEPVPKVVDPGPYTGMVPPPSDAIVLFDGRDLSKWKSRDGGEAKWKVEDGVMTVVKGTGDISTRQKFGDYQLHIEWKVPEDIQGSSQARGNSGLFLQDLSDDLKIPEYWYEVQILDNYKNATYVNGQAGSVYKQNPPLVNAVRKPGEWNVYDVVYTGPRFNENGSVFSPARVTVIHNGILIQDNFEIKGHTAYIGFPAYKAPHGKAPISLQDHGDPSKAISFRNIWIRER
jgi:hypothetical protein